MNNSKTPDPGSTNGSSQKKSGRAGPSRRKFAAVPPRGALMNNDPFMSSGASPGAGNLFGSTAPGVMNMTPPGMLPFVGSSKKRGTSLVTPPGHVMQPLGGGPAQTPGSVTFSENFGTPTFVAFSQDLATPTSATNGENAYAYLNGKDGQDNFEEGDLDEGDAENETTKNDEDEENRVYDGPSHVQYPSIPDEDLTDAPSAYDPKIPQSMNNIEKYRLKTKGDKDPNGRVGGRKLVMWHRPRMMAKLILHLQYECFKADIPLPWDKVAHRLSPGSSGPAIIQYLNKLRDYLVVEGHLIPPNMGKSSAVHDDKIRGYVRDTTKDVPYEVRSVRWDEDYPDAKENLVVPGLTTGSGKYSRAKDRPVIAKPIGRRYRVPPEIKAEMDRKREKRKPKNPGIYGGKGIRKDRKKREYGYENIKVEVADEEDPADLDSDDDYTPGVTATGSTKRKSRASASGRRKKIREQTLETGSENTPTKKKSILPVKLHLSPEVLAKFPPETSGVGAMTQNTSEPNHVENADFEEHSTYDPSFSQQISSASNDVKDQDEQDDVDMARADSHDRNQQINLPPGISRPLQFPATYGEFFNAGGDAVGPPSANFSTGVNPQGIAKQVRRGETVPYSQQPSAVAFNHDVFTSAQTGAIASTCVQNSQVSGYTTTHGPASATHGVVFQSGTSYSAHPYHGTPFVGSQSVGVQFATQSDGAQPSGHQSARAHHGSAQYGGMHYGSGHTINNDPGLLFAGYPAAAYIDIDQYEQYHENANASMGASGQGDFYAGDFAMTDAELAGYGLSSSDYTFTACSPSGGRGSGAGISGSDIFPGSAGQQRQ